MRRNADGRSNRTAPAVIVLRFACIVAYPVTALLACRGRDTRISGESSGVADTAHRVTAVATQPASTGPSTKAAPARPSASSPAQSAAAKPAVRAESSAAKPASPIPTATTTAPTPAPTPAPPLAPPGPSPLALALAKLPFQKNERLEYQVKYGFLGVGGAALEVLGLDTVRGTPTIHAAFTVKGG